MTELPTPILVTGAAGFAGSHLLDLIVQGPAPIVGWHRPDAPPIVHQDDVRWVSIDLLDGPAVERALATIAPGEIYHLAGAAHVGHSWQHALETYQGNVLATHTMLDALGKHGLKPRVLVAGSGMIYKPQDRPIRETDPVAPTSPYATSKLAQEMLCRHAWTDDGLPTLLARSFNHVGPRQNPSFVAPAVARQIALIEDGRQEPVLHMGNLEPRRDLTDVRDTVRGYVAMMAGATPGQVYNVCSGRALSIAALVEAFTSRSRVRVEIVQDPERFRPNDAPSMIGDHTRLTTDTGWTPEIPLEQTVEDLLQYWRKLVG